MWFTVLVSACAAVVFPRGRVRFWNSSGTGGVPLQAKRFSTPVSSQSASWLNFVNWLGHIYE